MDTTVLRPTRRGATVTIETIGPIPSIAAGDVASLRVIDAPFAIDLNGNITAWSTGAEALFGRDEDGLLDTHISSLFAKARSDSRIGSFWQTSGGHLERSNFDSEEVPTGFSMDSFLWNCARMLQGPIGCGASPVSRLNVSERWGRCAAVRNVFVMRWKRHRTVFRIGI